MDRFAGRCGLCDRGIDEDLKHPDPMSFSVDHIIPLARGGEHTYANTQPAHLRCNLSKGVRTSVDVA
ncbi:HNH endonuclease [Pseudonocardia sediminis]|nr:HNH endonuclease [Pseudonocardia sediminis]